MAKHLQKEVMQIVMQLMQLIA